MAPNKARRSNPILLSFIQKNPILLSSCFVFLIMIIISWPPKLAKSYIGEYEYLQLVQQWQPAVCRGKKCLQKAENFSIHGMWPSNCSGNYVIFCKGSVYDPSAVEQIRINLSIYWPDLYTSPSAQYNAFWGKEWKKHGTCSENTFNQSAYFARALEMHMDILNILKSSNIDPGGNVMVRKDVVENAIKNGTNKKPGLRCNNSSDIHKELFEVSLCYDYAGKHLINCPETKGD